MSNLIEDTIADAEGSVKILRNPRLMTIMTRAFSAPGVLREIGEALGHRLNESESQQVLDFLKTNAGTPVRSRAFRKRGRDVSV